MLANVFVPDPPPPGPRTLVIEHLEIRPNECQVLVDGRRVRLTVREFEIFYVLVQHRDRVVRRQELYDIDGVWSPTPDARTGLRAWRLDVTSLSAGAANRLLSLQDNGLCAPSATVGAGYIARVRLSLDGAYLGSRTAAPWRWKLATADLAPGGHILSSSAEDMSGHVTRSVAVTVVR